MEKTFQQVHDGCEVVYKPEGEGGDRNDGKDGGKDDLVNVGDVEWLILFCLRGL